MVDVALAWIFQHPGMTAAIVGIRNEKEAGELLGSVTWKVPEDDLKRIDETLQESSE